MPPKLDNVIKSPHYFRNVNLDKVQIKFNNWKVEIMDAFANLRCCYSTWWHHELDITTTYSTISNTWPNKITWLQSFLHKLCTIPTSICKYLNFRSTFIALATLVLTVIGLTWVVKDTVTPRQKENPSKSTNSVNNKQISHLLFSLCLCFPPYWRQAIFNFALKLSYIKSYPIQSSLEPLLLQCRSGPA